jgi:hypothetical protein
MFYCLHLAPIVNRLWTHITPLYRPRYEYRAQLLSPGDRDAEGAVAERVSAAVSVLMQETTTDNMSVFPPLSRSIRTQGKLKRHWRPKRSNTRRHRLSSAMMVPEGFMP